MDIKKTTAILIITLSGFFFHYKYLNEFPSHIHAWAQADNYALAIGFVNNGLNFFQPETYVYNHQFPDDWQVPSTKTVTSVNFPLHQFIPALFMKITGEIQPWYFRIYVLLYSFAGLFFLFKLSLLITKNYYKALFSVIFAMTSPVFIYYQTGMLPTIPSLSNAIIGIFFYIKHAKAGNNRDFKFSILFLTLAALSRTTFSIPLIAVLLNEILRLFTKSQIKIKQKVIPVLLSFASIILYIIYNNYLRNKYGSLFLNHLLPPSDFDEAIEWIKLIKTRWVTYYFTNVHYIVSALLLMIALPCFFIRYKKTIHNTTLLNFIMLTLIIFAGDILFFIAMMQQFPNHDYYFLDTFYIPAVMLPVVLLTVIPDINGRYGGLIYIFLIAGFLFFVSKGLYETQNQKHTSGYWDRIQTTIDNFQGADKFLDSLGVTRSAKILVIDAYAPNIPFILMKRKGYAVLSTQRENIERALQWDYDYLIIQNDFFLSDIYSVFPEILSHIEKIGANGHIFVCKKSENGKPQTLDDFLGLSGKTPVFSSKITFDTIVEDKRWRGLHDTTGIAFSGKKSGYLSSDKTFGISFKSKSFPVLKEKSRTLKLSSYFLQDTIRDCKIVVSISQNKGKRYFKTYSLNYFIKHPGTWEHVILTFQLPQVTGDEYEFALFLWNTGHAEMFIDDFEISIY